MSLTHEPGVAALRLLVAVADEGGLGAGARAVGMAQSNASRTLAGLEQRLGLTLVTRSAAGSTLTADGELIVEWARSVVMAMDRLLQGVAALQHEGRDLVVSASMTIAEYLAPSWLAAMRRDHPGVAASMVIHNSADVIDDVRRGRVGLGFVEGPEVPGDLQRVRVGADRLVVVVAPEHPWADRRGGVTVEELGVTALVERERGSGTRSFLDQAVPGRRVAPLVELSSNGAVVAAVAAGLGPAVLSIHAVLSGLVAGRLLAVPIVGGSIERDLHAVWRGPSEPTGPAALFLATAMGA
ncbi:LysR family transcriptional regulator [Tessaracoccus sp. Y36]